MLSKALSQYGITEIEGDKSAKEVEKYFNFLGFKFTDETPWCGAYMAWCHDLKEPKLVRAREWLDVGIGVIDPHPGDIIVLKRGDNQAEGHVGMFISSVGNQTFILGGNQRNMVCIVPFPTSSVIGYRRIV